MPIPFFRTATNPLGRHYASPLIAERRSRILDETKRLIGEAIRAMPRQIFCHWLSLARRDEALAGTIDMRETVRLFANLEWAGIKD